MQLSAPAKINLSFKIHGARPDGYHEVETLMAPISLCDRLTIESQSTASGIVFACDDASLPGDDDNLVMRAACVFFAAAKIDSAVRITLEKRIPHGAGLGGGSSDAASTLLGLNQLFSADMGRDKLAELAAGIGSDVPFFIYESAATCRGRGELVTPSQLEKRLPILLLKPSFGVPTPSAFKRWKNSQEIPGISYEPQEFEGDCFVNDLERPVFEKYAFLARMKSWLREQPEVGAALLSGSGSTVFAVLHDPNTAADLAIRARAELDPELWSCGCETVTHPR